MAKEGSLPPVSPPVHTIFVDTSIGTHLAMTISLHDAISDVKEKIRDEHVLCFKDIGEITIQAVKVRRRGFFYNLADSMPVMNAFDGIRGSWFIHIDAVPACSLRNQVVATCNDVHDQIVLRNSADRNKRSVEDQSNVVMPAVSTEHENQNPQDNSLKVLPAENDPAMQNRRISTAKILQVSTSGELTTGVKRTKMANKIRANEPNLHEDMLMCTSKPEKGSVSDGHRRRNSIYSNIDGETEMSIDEKGLKKKGHRKLDIESNDGIASAGSAAATLLEIKKSGQTTETSHHDKLLKSRLQILGSGENINISVDTDNVLEGTVTDKKHEMIADSLGGSPSKLAHENSILHQSPPVEKPKKKRKSKSSHGEACPTMTSDVLVTESAQRAEGLHISGKETSTTICKGYSATEVNADKSFPNDKGDLSKEPNAEKDGQATDTAMTVNSSVIKESVEDQFSQFDPVGQGNKKSKKRKKLKSHEEVSLPNSSETLGLLRTADPCNLAKGVGTAMCLETCSTEANIYKITPNNDGDLSKKPCDGDQKEKDERSMETNVAIASSLHKEGQLGNPSSQDDKRKKRKRRSPKSHEEVCVAMQSETLVEGSPSNGINRGKSGKEAVTGLGSEKYATEANYVGALPSLGNDLRKEPDIKYSFDMANQKEQDWHSVETSVAEGHIEDLLLQHYSAGQGEMHINLVNECSDAVIIKEAEKPRNSSSAASESCKILKPTGKKDGQDMEFDSAKFLKGSNLKENKVMSINAGLGVFSSTEQEHATNEISKDSLGDKHLDLDKEFVVAANLKEVDGVGICSEAAPNVSTKTRHGKKSAKSVSCRILESTGFDAESDFSRSNNAKVCTAGLQNNSDPQHLIKEADQKAMGDHCLDNGIMIASSIKKFPNQDNFSDLNSTEPLIGMNLDSIKESSSLGERGVESKLPSHNSSEIPTNSHHNQKKPKNESCKRLTSTEISDGGLPKSNGCKLNSDIEERSSGPSKTTKRTNHKVEPCSINVKVVVVPLSSDDYSKPVDTQVNSVKPLNCNQDLSIHSSTKIMPIDGVVMQTLTDGAAEAPTLSKSRRRKSKNQVSKEPDPLEANEHKEHRKTSGASVDFINPLVINNDRHDAAVLTTDLRSKKSKIGKKAEKISRKKGTNQSNQVSVGDIANSTSDKYIVECFPQGCDISNHDVADHAEGIVTKDSKVRSGRQETHDHDMADHAEGNIAKDSKVPSASKSQKAKQSNKRNAQLNNVEATMSPHRSHEDDHNLEKMHQILGSQSHVRQSKSNDMKNKHGKRLGEDGIVKVLSKDDATDGMVSENESLQHKGPDSSAKMIPYGDYLGSNQCDASRNDGMVNMDASSNSTEEKPYQLRRYRVVRKVPSRRSGKTSDNSNQNEPFLATSGGIFNDTSATSSESENNSQNRIADIDNASYSSTSSDSEMALENTQRSITMETQMDTAPPGLKFDGHGSNSKEANGTNNGQSRSGASANKVPLSAILRSSSSYKKAKLTASQSEFEDPESQPTDVAQETQREAGAP
ncbi:4'-phosphopantetheinyl transferase [Apostasia shenzhenica]|uniref:4'-phosphopantetheinyl transferase n=1 Tax=Apostasia shenzhenica TaxID=1088818 RepID=A0A2I0A253_9ASPA|nr:4'-phosphopantetheinyl transferase [Apostasia shenzhenica]